MIEALDQPFFVRALLAGLLASVAAGIVGSYVVVRRIASISGGLSHAAFGGVGLGYLLGFSPLLGAAGFALLCALGIGLAYDRMRDDLDTLISTIWASGMALGLIFVSLGPGYAPDLMSFLFGSLLFVPARTVQLVAVLDVAILATVLLLFRELRAVCFDEEFARVMGVPVRFLFLLLLALVALAVVTLVQVVGLVLVIALLTVPAAAARQWCDRLGAMMALACLLGAVSTTGGLLLSWELSMRHGLDVPTGPLVILVAVALYAASTALRRLRSPAEAR